MSDPCKTGLGTNLYKNLLRVIDGVCPTNILESRDINEYHLEYLIGDAAKEKGLGILTKEHFMRWLTIYFKKDRNRIITMLLAGLGYEHREIVVTTVDFILAIGRRAHLLATVTRRGGRRRQSRRSNRY